MVHVVSGALLVGSEIWRPSWPRTGAGGAGASFGVRGARAGAWRGTPWRLRGTLVCGFENIYIYIHIYMYTYTYICVCVYVFINIYICHVEYIYIFI